MPGAERWAKLRREHFVGGVSIKGLSPRTGRRGTRSGSRRAPSRRRRSARPSQLDAFKDEIHELLRRDPRLPGVRVSEPIEPLGPVGGNRAWMTLCGRSGRCC
jgi:hypothetical protein